MRIGAHDVQLSNLDKVFFRARGLRKGDLILYYMDLADAVLPGTEHDLTERFAEAFDQVWSGHVGADGFNALVLREGLTWRQAAVLRAFSRYLRQIGSAYGQGYITEVVGAHREAAGQYARALRFADGLAEAARAGLLERQSDAYYLTDDQLLAIAALEEAIAGYRRAGDVRGEARGHSGLVSYLACRGRMTEADQAATQAIVMLDGLPDSGEHAEAANAMALLAAFRGDDPAVERWGTRAVELATRFDDPVTRIDAAITLGTVELYRDGIDHTAALELALEQARRRGLANLVARAMHNLAAGFWYLPI